MLDLILIAKYLKLTNILESLRKLKFDKTFFLTATTPQEIYDIISAFGTKKSLGPNTGPFRFYLFLVRYLWKLSINTCMISLTRTN